MNVSAHDKVSGRDISMSCRICKAVAALVGH